MCFCRQSLGLRFSAWPKRGLFENTYRVRFLLESTNQIEAACLTCSKFFLWLGSPFIFVDSTNLLTWLLCWITGRVWRHGRSCYREMTISVLLECAVDETRWSRQTTLVCSLLGSNWSSGSAISAYVYRWDIDNDVGHSLTRITVRIWTWRCAKLLFIYPFWFFWFDFVIPIFPECHFHLPNLNSFLCLVFAYAEPKQTLPFPGSGLSLNLFWSWMRIRTPCALLLQS